MSLSADFTTIFKFTSKWEGLYVNDPDDPGGATMRGVTQVVYDHYRAVKKLPRRPVKEISKEEHLEIFHDNYWKAGHCEFMPKPLNMVHFDTCINFGIRGSIKYQGAVRLLQRALNLTPDGILGPVSRGVILSGNPKEMALKYIEMRKVRRHERIKQAPSQEKYLPGWLNRDNDLIAFINKLK